MKPYPAYKDSGVEWIGKVPEHWEVKRLKFAAVINPSKSELSGLPGTLEVSFYPMEAIGFGNLNGGEEKTLDAVGSGFTYFRDDDVLVAKITPSFENGKGALATGLKNGIGFGTTEIHVIRPEKSLNKYFLYYLTYSHQFRTIGEGMMEGTAGQKRVPNDFLFDYPLTLPPLSEQTAIAAYLDRKTVQIDTLIEQKRRLIELLQEERTALISQTVTKGLAGLNTDWRSLQDCASLPPGYKDSGIEWIGMVPVGWEVAVLKFVAEIQSGLTLGNKYDDIETVTRPYLRVANVQDGYLDLETITTIDLPIAKVARYELQRGDVLMTEGGDFDKLGRGYVWEGQIEGCLHQNHVFAVRPNPDLIRSHFLAALTTSFHGKNYFTSTSQQTTNLATINQTTLGQFPLLLPPLEEQDAILNFLYQKTAQIDQTIARTERQIELLQEYRTALISAVVTGKVDVRGE